MISYTKIDESTDFRYHFFIHETRKEYANLLFSEQVETLYSDLSYYIVEHPFHQELLKGDYQSRYIDLL